MQDSFRTCYGFIREKYCCSCSLWRTEALNSLQGIKNGFGILGIFTYRGLVGFNFNPLNFWSYTRAGPATVEKSSMQQCGYNLLKVELVANSKLFFSLRLACRLQNFHYTTDLWKALTKILCFGNVLVYAYIKFLILPSSFLIISQRWVKKI